MPNIEETRVTAYPHGKESNEIHKESQSALLRQLVGDWKNEFEVFSGYFTSTGSLDYSAKFSEAFLTQDEGTSTGAGAGRPPFGGRRQVISVGSESLDDRLEPAKKANADRIALLARKYAAKDMFSTEEFARLQIVTERVRQLLPAVTASDLETIETIALQLNKIRSTNEELRQDLALKRE